MNQSAEIQPDPKAAALIANITQLMDEAEQMLCDSTSHHGEGQIEQLRARGDDLQRRITEFFSEAGKKIGAGVHHTDQAIRACPYQSLLIALGAGALLGMVFTRRSS